MTEDEKNSIKVSKTLVYLKPDTISIWLLQIKMLKLSRVKTLKAESLLRHALSSFILLWCFWQYTGHCFRVMEAACLKQLRLNQGWMGFQWVGWSHRKLTGADSAELWLYCFTTLTDCVWQWNWKLLTISIFMKLLFCYKSWCLCYKVSSIWCGLC